MTPRGIVLDLDGTLTDSKPGLLASLRHMHEALAWPVPADDELLTWLGPPTSVVLAEAGHDAPTVERAIAAFRARLHAGGLLESTMYDGIDALLTDLHAAGVPLAIATHKIQPDAEAVARHYRLERLVAGVHGRIDGEAGHSKAAVIARALASLGLAPHEAVMVGDRVHDIASAKELGMRSIGVAYGYGGRAELEEAGADAIAETVAELRALLLPSP